MTNHLSTFLKFRDLRVGRQAGRMGRGRVENRERNG